MPGLQIAIIQALQSQQSLLGVPMAVFSFLGAPEFYLVAVPVLYWCWDPRLGFRLGILLGISTGLNDVLKIAVHSPRPYWVSPEVKALNSHPSFGLPSAHAQAAVTFWGPLAATVRRRGVWVLAAILIVLIGVSRIYEGVHYPIDTISGWLVGAAVLLAFLRWEGPVGSWLSSFPLRRQILAAFLASLTIVALSLIAIASLGDWQLPAEWMSRALEKSGELIHPLFPRDTAIAAGLLFGFAAGGAAQSHKGVLCAAGRGAERLVMYVLGIAVAGIIWLVLGLAIPPEMNLHALVLHYIRAAAAGAWISFGAPEFFAYLNLMERDRTEQEGHPAEHE